ncbi:phosphosulfolactate synthase [Paenibacillus crassostreae]|uniref:Phosphosulfolactate synthase n=1 Tax=Paenibacillus crassostreae TaxID=1763538 RepID=A0A167FZV5_9BACL|nr:phosphosulfolactate synthase [Paenibacillus crassostreae]AOZ93903.1 phosphosulfolactate synthase [Paenibacillus crassostreae]OAB77065.1 phosphosulfolactate synthase [Paenibacillus crassostreae]
MKGSRCTAWPQELSDPSGLRKESTTITDNGNVLQVTDRGHTMVIDKGLGRNSFIDLIETASHYIDCVKLGFGTAPLYNDELLTFKINLAKKHGIIVIPGGTLLEAAVQQNVVPEFFNTICNLGFNGIEVSDGTIELSRWKRTELIQEGRNRDLQVYTEYGKKLSGSIIDAELLARTLEIDLNAGAKLITVEARESGVGVGIFDDKGECRVDILDAILQFIPDTKQLMWEAPLKHQQVMFLRKFGSDVNLGNIPTSEILALETMRRGLRQDTFEFGVKASQDKEFVYMI